MLESGPGKMTDWRDIAGMIESFATVFHLRHSPISASDNHSSREVMPDIPTALNPPMSSKRSDDRVEEDSLDGYSGDLVANVTEEQASAPQSSGTVSRDSGREWDRIWPKS